MFKFFSALCMLAVLSLGCFPEHKPSADEKQQKQQEAILQQATDSVGMPAIKNFRERKFMKEILELRDQEGIVTYTYVWSEFKGKYRFIGESVGYGIPYATQFTSPEYKPNNWSQETPLPQADPNGLFSPASAEGTWVLLKNPSGKETLPTYIENRVLVSPFKLDPSVVATD